MRISGSHRSEHLPAEHLQATPLCPICGARDRVPLLELQKEPRVSLLACPACGGASASSMPTEACLSRYYESYHEGRSQKVTFTGSERFARRLSGMLRRQGMHAPRRILDFGGGDGTLSLATVELMGESGAVISLVDQAGVLPSDSRIRTFKALKDLDGGDFDLIIASAVLEHIPQLGELLENLFGRLMRGGLFYARTAFVAPLCRVLPIDFGFPAHVHDLGSEFWRKVPGRTSVDLVARVSRPSIVATEWRSNPVATTAAYLLKWPGALESSLAGPDHRKYWGLVGGWEVLLERAG